MTRSARLLAIAVLAVPALAAAQERGPDGGHAARPTAPPRPAAAPHVPAARPIGAAGARPGFSGYAPYERTFPGGVRGQGSIGANGGFGRGARPPGVGSGPDRSGPDRPGPDRSGPNRFGPDRSGPNRFGPDRFGGAVGAGAGLGVNAARPGLGATRPGFGGDRPGDGARGAGGRAGFAGPGGFERGRGAPADVRADARGEARGRAGRPAGYAPGGRGGFSYRGREYARFRAPAFRYPQGYGYRNYGRGQYLPRVFLYDSFFLNDYADFYLAPPPGPEYRWVRYGPDALLVDVDTGEVVDAAYGVFDDGGGYAAGADGDGGGYGSGQAGYGYGRDEDDGYGPAPQPQPYGDARDGEPDGDGGYDPPPR